MNPQASNFMGSSQTLLLIRSYFVNCFFTMLNFEDLKLTLIPLCFWWDSNITSVMRQQANLRKELTRKQVRQIFQKTNTSYPQIGTHTCAYQWIRNVRFSKIFFSCYLRFEICPVALLPTIMQSLTFSRCLLFLIVSMHIFKRAKNSS